MPSVIQLTRYRAVTHRDLPMTVPHGDSDLRAIGALLWVGSAVRTLLALIHHQAFGIEATLALLCVLGIPLLHLRARHASDTAEQ